MRIIYVITSLGVGGAEKQICSVCDYLVKSYDYNIHIVVLNNNLKSKPKNKKIKITSLNLRKNPISLIYSFKNFIKLINKFKPDLIHAHLFHSIILTRIIRLIFFKIPIISTMHNALYRLTYREILLKYTDFLSNLNTAVSFSALNSYLRKGVFSYEKSKFIYNGIDLKEFEFNKVDRNKIRLKEKVSKKTLLFIIVARLIYSKGIWDILKIFKNISGDNKLIIIGEGPLKNDIENFIQSKNLRHKVQIRKSMSNIKEYLSAADILLNLSYEEGFSLISIEAIANKTPIMASDIDTHKEIIKNNGFLFKQRDLKDLNNKIEKFINLEKNFLDKKANYAYKEIKRNFSIEKTCESWHNTYRDICK